MSLTDRTTGTEKPPVNGAAIEVDGLSVAYNGHCALQSVTQRIAGGKITAIVGPSGCGKTTFLTTLNRLTDLIPGCTVSGRIRCGETDVLDPQLDVVAHRRRVGMIFQKPNPFPLSIERNLDLPLKEWGMTSRRERAAVIEKTLRDVGLWDEVKDRLKSPAVSLSGGQQQRLCLARALALQPEILLLDEPCSALDPRSTSLVEEQLAGMRGRFTLVIVTHNLAQAKRLADEVIVFGTNKGTGFAAESGPAEQVFTAPQTPAAQEYFTAG